MQADTQSGVLAGQGDGFAGERGVDHEAGTGEDAFAMGADDGLVDGLGAAKIVGVDDEPAPG